MKNFHCLIEKANCQAARISPNSYPTLWVKKGYARSIVQRDFEYIYLGRYQLKTLSIGLINSQLGGNSTDSPTITLGADDWEVDISQKFSYDWYSENVIYYGTRYDNLKPGDEGFLDDTGEFNGKIHRLLELRNTSLTHFKLILREIQERKLGNNGSIYGQKVD